MRALFPVAIVFSVACAVFPAVPPPGAPLVRHLDNGLSVVLVEDHANPAVASYFVVRAGRREETAATCGLSHFLEHLIFNGTERRDQKSLYEELDLLGVYHNAFTREDSVCFLMYSPLETFPQALDLQLDMLFHSALPADKFEKERGIVLEEMAQGALSPYQVLEDAAARGWYGDAPLGRPALGTEASIRALSREAVMDFYHRFYGPSRCTLLLVGDFRAEEMFRSVRARLAREAGGAPAAPPTEAETRLGRRGTVQRIPVIAASGRILVALPAPGPAATRRKAWELALGWLADPDRSPLAEGLAKLGFATFSLDPAGPGAAVLALEIPAGRKVADGEIRALFDTLAGTPLALSGERFDSLLLAREADDVFGRENIHIFGMRVAETLARLSPEQAATALAGRFDLWRRGLAPADVVQEARAMLGAPGAGGKGADAESPACLILEAQTPPTGPARPGMPPGMPAMPGRRP